jgi:hypothetical protein
MSGLAFISEIAASFSSQLANLMFFSSEFLKDLPNLAALAMNSFGFISMTFSASQKVINAIAKPSLIYLPKFMNVFIASLAA